MRTLKQILAIILASTIHFAYCQVQPWSAPDFRLDDFSPRMFYWDTVTDYFYIGGNIYSVDSQKVNGLFRIDSVGSVDYMDTINPNADPTLEMVKYKDTLYHAGVGGLYTYKNSEWNPIIPGPNVFYSMTVYNNELLIGGLFQNVISGSDGIVIRYDGTNFSPFHDICNILDKNGSSVLAFKEYKGKLYIAGNFQNDNYNEILAWDGSNWNDLDSGILGNSGYESIGDLEVYKGELYVAGAFRTEWGSKSNNILKWDGSNWLTIGNGIYGQGVADLMVYRDELWVSGGLDSVDNLPLSNVAIWNGEYWCSPGGEFPQTVLAMGVYGDTLYAGGNFWDVDGDPKKQLLIKYNPDAPRTCGSPVGINKLSHEPDKIHIFPNPNNGQFTLETNHNHSGIIWVYDSNGMVVYTRNVMSSAGTQINLPESISNGLYFLKYQSDSENFVTRFVVTQN